jgi:ribosomal protein S8
LKIICTLLDDLPYKSENDENKLNYLILFNEYLKRIPAEKLETEILSNMDKKYYVKLYDALNKNFEILSESKEGKVKIIIKYILVDRGKQNKN